MQKKGKDIHIVIADDHSLFREGLKTVIKKNPSFHVIGEASDGRELVNIVLEKKPDIVLTDIVMPVMDGIAATKMIHEKFPGARVIALSMYAQESYVTAMLEAGALGYLLKDTNRTELEDAIYTVYNHVPYYSDSTSQTLTGLIAKSSFNPYHNKSVPLFSENEMSVIKLICEQKVNKEIADILSLSTRTVEGYRLRIQEKMMARNTVGIVIGAIKMGIYNVGDSKISGHL